jgi:siroheme synthase (precorrin-2 oxidase/ferrochelatase)
MTGPQRVAWYWPRDKTISAPMKRRRIESAGGKRQHRAPVYTVDNREGCTVYRPTTWQSRAIEGNGQ